MSLWKWEEIQELLWKKSVIAMVTEILPLDINYINYQFVNDLSTEFLKCVDTMFRSLENKGFHNR